MLPKIVNIKNKNKYLKVIGILNADKISHTYSPKRPNWTFCKICLNNDASEIESVTTHAQKQRSQTQQLSISALFKTHWRYFYRSLLYPTKYKEVIRCSCDSE